MTKLFKPCHSELVSESSHLSGGRTLANLTDGKMLKQVQHDKNRRGFTLAEVLITLAIIGIVAAMTIPTLISKHQERQIVSHLTKAYATVSNAFKMAETEHGSIDTWGLNRTDMGRDADGNSIYDFSSKGIVAERIKPYLRVAKECVDGEVCDNCDVYYLSGNLKSSAVQNTNYYGGAFILQDGSFIQLGWYYDNSSFMDFSITLPYDSKRVLGKNIFVFRAYPGRVVPEGVSIADLADGVNNFKTSCRPDNTGRYCAGWVIYNKNMDYLHCADDLSWDGKHQCSD